MVSDKYKRDQFIESNLGLVHSLCKRFVGRGIEYDDLFQAGCMGLVKATDAFDERRGLCFSTYAVPVVLGEIKRLFRDGGSVKVSRSLKELSYKVNREKANFLKNTGREPVCSELAEILGVSEEQIAEAVSATQPTVSLTYGEDNENTEIDLPTISTEDEISNKLLLDSVFDKLDETERKIIKCRYYEYMTQAATAKKLSMTQVQISRAEKKILLKLRKLLC